MQQTGPLLEEEEDPIQWAMAVFELDKIQTQLTPSLLQEKILSVGLLQSKKGVDIRKLKIARDILMSVYAYCVQKSSPRNFLMQEFTSEDDTPFQRLLLFILKRLRETGLRRLHEFCCGRVSIEGVATLAWQKTCTVKEFVILETKKETNTSQWKNLTHSRENFDSVCRTLIEFQHTEFPDLNVDESLICFVNGTFSIKNGTFWKHGEEKQEDLSSTSGESLDTTCTCSFVNTVFRDNLNTDNFAGDLSNILTDMGMEHPYHFWFFALMGRLLFPVNSLERWQVMPFFKTSTNCDSLIFNTFVTIFDTITGPKTVCKLNGNLPLDVISGFRICAMMLRETCPIDQGDWHLTVCGEFVHLSSSLRGKFQTSQSTEWKIPFIGVGSGFPYKNDAGTVDRRVVLFDVSKATETEVERMANFILDNIDLWLAYTVKCYLEMTVAHGDHNLWDVLPPEFVTTRNKLKEITNPLLSCIKSSSFRQDASFFMPLSDFKDMYQDFRRQRGLPSQRWVREHWQATFQDEKLLIERGQREWNSTKSTTDWLIGISPVYQMRELDLVVTPELVETLRREADVAQKRYNVATELLTIDQQLLNLKAERSIAKQAYRDLES